MCEICPHPHSRSVDFIVVSENGHHAVSLAWCGCPGAKDRVEQLLEAGWWPATQSDPDTAYTMSCLQRFHVLNLQGKVPPTDYYRTLEQLSNGHGLIKCPVNLSPLFGDWPLTFPSNVLLDLCWRFANGGTLRCASGVDVVTASPEYRERNWGALLCIVEHARYLRSIYPMVGTKLRRSPGEAARPPCL